MLQSHDCDRDLDQGKDCVDVVKFYETIFHAAVYVISRIFYSLVPKLLIIYT